MLGFVVMLQVRSLLELFRPLDVSSPAPTPLVLNELYSPPTLPSPPVNGVFQQTSRTSLTEDSILSRMSPNQAPRQLNYQHVNEPGKPTGSAYPVNNLMSNSVAAHFVLSQASGNQTHVPPILNPQSEFYSSLMQDPQRGYAQSWQDSQRTHLNVLHPQPEIHSSMRTIGNGYAPSMQDPQHAHFNALHPQHMGNSYAQSMQDPQHAHLNALHPQLVGNSYPQSMQDPQHADHNVLHPQLGSHPSTWNMGGSYAQSLQHSQHAHLNVLQPHQQPEFHSSMMTMGNSYAQPLQDPQHPHQSIPNQPHGFHPQVANVGSGHAEMLWNPHGTYQNTPYSQPDAYSNTANMGSSYAESFPDPQHAHQNAQNLRPHSSSSVVNMNHANVALQSHAQSALYYPYVPQQVTSATYSNQTGAIQEVIYSGQQTGTGSQYYQPSMQRENVSTAENVVSHLH